MKNLLIRDDPSGMHSSAAAAMLMAFLKADRGLRKLGIRHSSHSVDKEVVTGSTFISVNVKIITYGALRYTVKLIKILI